MGKSKQTSAGYDYPPPVQTILTRYLARQKMEHHLSCHHWPPFYKHNTDPSL